MDQADAGEVLVTREPAVARRTGGLGVREGAAPVGGAARAVRVVGQREDGAGGADGLDGAEVVAVRVLEAFGAGLAVAVGDVAGACVNVTASTLGGSALRWRPTHRGSAAVPSISLFTSK